MFARRSPTFIFLLITVFLPNQGLTQRTYLDNNIDVYRGLRRRLFNFLRPYNEEDALALNIRNGKVQKQFSKDQPFFCDPYGPGRRSSTVPTSVHKLRPGDIDIVGAIGDSLTAGNGALATNSLQILREYKGISWSIGGQGTWRQFLTLPNILKEFNPNLYGYPIEDGVPSWESSRFNAAEPGAMSHDMPYMANILVKRMKSDPKVDLNNHWKVITMMIGPNDFCSDMCYLPSPEKILSNQDKFLTAVLRTFRDNLPRTIVNVVSTPSMKVLLNFVGKPQECIGIHIVECPCMFGLQFQSQRKRFLKIQKKWNDVQYEVANRDEFQNRTDFVVNIQPWAKNLKFPKNIYNKTNFEYMSADCFHLSQKGYTRGSNALWNNMLEPEGQKSTDWTQEFNVFKCPTESQPYLMTRQNSKLIGRTQNFS